jgi:hypothetical protein
LQVLRKLIQFSYLISFFTDQMNWELRRHSLHPTDEKHLVPCYTHIINALLSVMCWCLVLSFLRAISLKLEAYACMTRNRRATELLFPLYLKTNLLSTYNLPLHHSSLNLILRHGVFITRKLIIIRQHLIHQDIPNIKDLIHHLATKQLPK